tara:strand:- start:428 stop:895 length:468 start_codon:yes stop_codon:yes gene_type:complete
MASLVFDIQGDKELLRRMKKRKKKLGGAFMRKANKIAAIKIDQWTQQNFRSEGREHDDSFLHWPPLSQKTIDRRRQGPGTGTPKMLQDTGRLRGGFEISANKGFGRVQNRVKYSVKHEFGHGRIPKRKMFPTVQQGEDIVFPAYREFVKRAINTK